MVSARYSGDNTSGDDAAAVEQANGPGPLSGCNIVEYYYRLYESITTLRIIPRRNIRGWTMKRLLIAVAFSAAFATASFADEPIKVRGCVMRGVEAGCLVLRTSKQTYDISAAQPRPSPGMYGQVEGMVWNGVSHCMQGQIINPAKWTPSPRLCVRHKPRK
jgi:hypothetical protein